MVSLLQKTLFLEREINWLFHQLSGMTDQIFLCFLPLSITVCIPSDILLFYIITGVLPYGELAKEEPEETIWQTWRRNIFGTFRGGILGENTFNLCLPPLTWVERLKEKRLKDRLLRGAGILHLQWVQRECFMSVQLLRPLQTFS